MPFQPPDELAAGEAGSAGDCDCSPRAALSNGPETLTGQFGGFYWVVLNSDGFVLTPLYLHGNLIFQCLHKNLSGSAFIFSEPEDETA